MAPHTPAMLPASGRIHVLGAGPVGLMLTALLQTMDGYSVHLYEKRREYTRTRMVRLAPYLVADSAESYARDHIDGETVAAVFDPQELDGRLEFRRSIAPDLMALLREWSQGFCPLNSIERALSGLIDERPAGTVERQTGVVTVDDAMAMLDPGDILVDCTGCASILRNRMVPGGTGAEDDANTLNIRQQTVKCLWT